MLNLVLTPGDLRPGTYAWLCDEPAEAEAEAIRHGIYLCQYESGRYALVFRSWYYDRRHLRPESRIAKHLCRVQRIAARDAADLIESAVCGRVDHARDLAVTLIFKSWNTRRIDNDVRRKIYDRGR